MNARPMIEDPLGGRRLVDMTGQKFGRLTVTSYAGVRGKGAAWLCVCECGSRKVVRRGNLLSGSTVSCGCFSRDQTSTRSIIHGRRSGQGYDRTYAIWVGMRERCYYPGSVGYEHYGGRGISVCDRWLNGDGERSAFECFVEDMGDAPHGLSIDRIDNDGNYEPGNCRWATVAEQNRNTRRNRFVVVRGERLCITDAASKYGLSKLTLVDRLNRGWSDEEAVLRPVQKKRRRR